MYSWVYSYTVCPYVCLRVCTRARVCVCLFVCMPRVSIICNFLKLDKNKKTYNATKKSK